MTPPIQGPEGVKLVAGEVVRLANRRELVRALAALLVAEVRQHPEGTTLPAASGVPSPGTARSVVGRLHPRPLASPAPLEVPR